MLKKVVSYSIWLYSVSIAASVMRVLVKSFIAKSIGKEALGAYAFYMAVIVLGSSLLAFGLKRSITKYVASSEGESQYAPVVTAVIALGVVISLAIAVIGLLVGGMLEWVFLPILLSVGPFALFEVARATLRGQFDQKREIIFAVLAIVIQVGCVILFILLDGSQRSPVWGVATANILLAVIIVIYFLWRYAAHWKPSALKAVVHTADFRGLMFLATPLWITDILDVVATQTDQYIVQGKLGFAALAEYAAAFAFIGILDQPITVLSRVFLVSFSSGHYSDFAQYKKLSSLSLAFFSILGLLVIALSFPLTPILFTSAYAVVPLLVSILSLATIFNSVEVLNSSLTIACDYPQANRNAKIITTAIYIPLAFILVSRFGVIGAAWSYAASWGIYALTHALLMWRRLPQHAAHTFRTLVIGTGLYLAAVGLAWWAGSPLYTSLTLFLYIGAGHLLRLWDLTQLPELFFRMIPASFPMKPAVQPDVKSDRGIP
jgi:O-antigen/teichoic acid export membrane protein